MFTVALAVRLTHLYFIRSTPVFSLLLGDSASYDLWAREIADGDWLGREVFYQAPLYPYFLAVVYSIAGRDLMIVRLIQAGIGSLSCVLVAVAGRRVVSPRVGMAAGLILALYAPLVFADALIQKSVLDVFFLSTALVFLPPKSALCLGVALAFLSLTRENALVLIAVTVVWLLLQRRWRSRDRLAQVGLLLAGSAIVLAPVALRNQHAGGAFTLTTAQLGPNLYIGNNPQSDGTYMSLRSGRGAPEYERQDATELAERGVGRPLTPREVSGYWTGRAVSYVRSDPLGWLRLMGRKFVLLWNRTEVVDTESQATHAEWSPMLRVLSPVMNFGLLVPLAVLGVWSSFHVVPGFSRARLKSGTTTLSLLYTLIVAYAASVLLFYVFARYRYPLVPLLAVPAAVGLTSFRWKEPVENAWWRRVFHKVQPDATYGVVVALAVAVFCNWPVLSDDMMRAVTEHNLATALQAEGRRAEAIAHYRRAMTIDPGYAPPHNNLGTLLRAEERYDEAIAEYRRALAIEPEYPSARYNLANALLAAGRADEAANEFRRVLQHDPRRVNAINNLGIALATGGRTREAAETFRRVLEVDPALAQAHYNLGSVLLDLGERERAIAELEEVVRLKPDFADARAALEAAQATKKF